MFKGSVAVGTRKTNGCSSLTMLSVISQSDRDLQRAWERLEIHYLDTHVSTLIDGNL